MKQGKEQFRNLKAISYRFDSNKLPSGCTNTMDGTACKHCGHHTEANFWE